MYTINLTSNFQKQYSKLVKKNTKIIKPIDKVVETLKENPFYPGLHTHIVDFDKEIGNIWSSRITGDIRVLWAIDQEQKLVIILLKIGGHDFVY